MSHHAAFIKLKKLLLLSLILLFINLDKVFLFTSLKQDNNKSRVAKFCKTIKKSFLFY
jgi:hypothetical protein